MKYMLKRIFIGVAIGTILFIIKGGNVFAASIYLYNAQSVVGDMSFDVCNINNDSESMICTNAFNKSLSLKSSNYTTLYTNIDKDIFLKSFSISATFGNGEIQASTYGNITNPMYTIFNSTSTTGYVWNKKLQVNFMPVYVKMTMQDDTICEITDNIGYDFQSGSRTTYPYWQVPSSCRSKWLKQIDIIFQSGYNYTGSTSILEDEVNDSSWSNQTWLNNNKNNTYLLWWHNQNIVLKSSVANLQLYFGSNGYGSSKINNSYTITDQEINENLAQLEKEKYLASLGGTDLGPSSPSQDNYTQIENGITSIQVETSSALNDVQFADFLSALTQKPILELMYMVRSDNVDSSTNVISCPSIYLPFKVNRSDGTVTYGMQLPCIRDYLEQIPYVGTTNTNANAFGFNLIYIYQLLLTGWLTYLLILTWLNLIKYTATRSSSEIEVLEL